MEEMADVESVILAGLVTHGLTLVAVLGAAVAVFVVLVGTLGRNLEQLRESLARLPKVLEQAGLDTAVLVALCQAKGTTAQELAAFYRQDGDRAAVVGARLGSGSRLTRRYLQSSQAAFLDQGYPQERHLAEYLNAADEEEAELDTNTTPASSAASPTKPPKPPKETVPKEAPPMKTPPKKKPSKKTPPSKASPVKPSPAKVARPAPVPATLTGDKFGAI